MPTSIFVCDTGGMVVICAGTTGYNAVVDLRYLWMRQKRFQGSHFANDEQAKALNDLVSTRRSIPASREVFAFDDIPRVHQLMHENRHPHGQHGVPGRRAAEGTRRRGVTCEAPTRRLSRHRRRGSSGRRRR